MLKEEVLFELFYAVKVLVADVAGIVVVQLEPEGKIEFEPAESMLKRRHIFCSTTDERPRNWRVLSPPHS